MRGLTRCDYEKARGWFARIQRRGVEHRRFFADAKHGGSAKARRLAVRWLAERERALPPPERHTPEPGPGRIYRAHKRVYSRTGRSYRTAHWCAWVRGADGRVRATAYSVRKHGERRARSLARAYLEAARPKRRPRR